MPSDGRILDPGDNSTIVNPPHSQPWAILVECCYSGTLNSERHVITSAQCGKVDYVVFREHNRMKNDGEEKIKVINNIPYPGYEYQHSNTK